MNDFDKEAIVNKIYQGEINSLSYEQINEMVVEFLQNVSTEFIMENELYFIIFQKKPFVENGNFVGELSSSLPFEKKQELMDFMAREFH